MQQGLGEWRDRYIASYSLYRDYTKRLEHLVQDLLEQIDLDLFHIESSTEGINDFLARLQNSREDVSSLEEIPDLSCIRVILYFAEDLEKVSRLVEEEFTIYPLQSVPFDALRDPDAYGYRSVRFAVSLSPERSSLREWRKYASLRGEIQIRTILQNAWATITKKLPYEEVQRSKSGLKRKLSRMSALLEEADEGFLTVWEFLREGALPEGVSGSVASGISKGGASFPPLSPPVKAQPVALPLTEEAFQNWGTVNESRLLRWADLAKGLGYPLSELPEEYQRESRGNLINLLRAAGIETIQDFNVFMEGLEQSGESRAHLEAIKKSFEGELQSWRLDIWSILFLVTLNARWTVLQSKDLAGLGIKDATERIKGISS